MANAQLHGDAELPPAVVAAASDSFVRKRHRMGELTQTDGAPWSGIRISIGTDGPQNAAAPAKETARPATKGQDVISIGVNRHADIHTQMPLVERSHRTRIDNDWIRGWRQLRPIAACRKGVVMTTNAGFKTLVFALSFLAAPLVGCGRSDTSINGNGVGGSNGGTGGTAGGGVGGVRAGTGGQAGAPAQGTGGFGAGTGGFNFDGGFNRDGFNVDGFNRDGFNRDGFNFDFGGFGRG